MNQTKHNKPRRLTKAEIIKAKERYRAMWEQNRPRMLKLAALGRQVISDRHHEDRQWLREWLASKPARMSREEIRRLIDQAKSRENTVKTESYIKTMIRYGYIRFDDEFFNWVNTFAKQ